MGRAPSNLKSLATFCLRRAIRPGASSVLSSTHCSHLDHDFPEVLARSQEFEGLACGFEGEYAVHDRVERRDLDQPIHVFHHLTAADEDARQAACSANQGKGLEVPAEAAHA